MNLDKAIQTIALKRQYTEADKIIRYLLNPDDETIELTDTEQRRYDILKAVFALRMRYSRKADIITMICHQFEIKERQARNYVNECEYVFGSTDGVHKAFERNFLLECSRKNIELAMHSRNSDLITKALMAHYKLCGLDEVHIEMPDFSALEPNKYEISLPPAQLEIFNRLISKGGVLNFNDLIPHQDVTFDISHKDVTDGE